MLPINSVSAFQWYEKHSFSWNNPIYKILQLWWDKSWPKGILSVLYWNYFITQHSGFGISPPHVPTTTTMLIFIYMHT